MKYKLFKCVFCFFFFLTVFIADNAGKLLQNMRFIIFKRIMFIYKHFAIFFVLSRISICMHPNIHEYKYVRIDYILSRPTTHYIHTFFKHEYIQLSRYHTTVRNSHLTS